MQTRFPKIICLFAGFKERYGVGWGMQRNVISFSPWTNVAHETGCFPTWGKFVEVAQQLLATVEWSPCSEAVSFAAPDAADKQGEPSVAFLLLACVLLRSSRWSRMPDGTFDTKEQAPPLLLQTSKALQLIVGELKSKCTIIYFAPPRSSTIPERRNKLCQGIVGPGGACRWPFFIEHSSWFVCREIRWCWLFNEHFLLCFLWWGGSISVASN